MSNITKATPRQARKFIVECIKAGLVPFLQGPPGIGKSVINHSISKDFNLQMIDHRLSTSEPTDLTGLPDFNNGRAYYAPFNIFPLEGDPTPEGKDGWLLFFDELPSASKMVQAAGYKVMLDRMIGQHRLHPNVAVVAAGNRMEDRAIVNSLSTAMQSRLVHIEMEVNHQEWLEDVALKQNYDSRIIAFLMQFPSKLMDFRPDHHEKTFACPRTWEFVNRLISGKQLDDDMAILLSGTITPGIAMEFYQFTKVFKDLININEILRDPENCRIPTDNSIKWATVTHMMDSVTDKNFSQVSVYADRFDLSFRILFYRSILIQKPNLRNHPDFGKIVGRISQYLYS